MTDFRKGDVCSLEVVVDVMWDDGTTRVVSPAGMGFHVPTRTLTLLRRAPVDLSTCELPVTVTAEGCRKTAVVARADTHALCRDNLGRWTAHAIADLRPLDAPAPESEVIEWIWFGQDDKGEGHLSFGRWPKNPWQRRYKLAEVQPTEHDHPALTCPPGHIMIGNRAVPEPMREAPDVGTFIYSANPGSPGLVGTRRWANDFIDRHQLMSGLIYPGTNEGHRAARAHAEAIIALSAGEGV